MLVDPRRLKNLSHFKEGFIILSDPGRQTANTKYSELKNEQLVSI